MTIANREAALDALRRHWSVIPFLDHDKRPRIPWQAYQQRHATPSEVEEWFRRWPHSNVGIVTGAISGVVVLDIDAGHGGEASLAQLQCEHGPLPHTVEVRSGGGGRHLYFSHPGGILPNRVGLYPGIDVRGDGGCLVIPPSVHASGNTYTWSDGHAPSHTPLVPLPAWLLQAITGTPSGTGHSLAYWRQLLRAGVVEGERNTTIASLCGHLLWHGVDPEVVQELLLCWNRVRCRPPLDDAEVVRTVTSIHHLHEQQADS